MDFGFMDSEEHCVDSNCDEFLGNVNHLVSKHYLKKIKQKALKLRSKPKINIQILQMMRIKDNLFQQFKQSLLKFTPFINSFKIKLVMN